MNTKRRAVEIRNSEHTPDIGYLQKAADYMKAFMLGFDQADAVALLRLDDLFIQSFEVKDVKRLQGDHLSRCIGRIAGKDGSKMQLAPAFRFVKTRSTFSARLQTSNWPEILFAT